MRRSLRLLQCKCNHSCTETELFNGIDNAWAGYVSSCSCCRSTAAQIPTPHVQGLAARQCRCSSDHLHTIHPRINPIKRESSQYGLHDGQEWRCWKTHAPTRISVATHATLRTSCGPLDRFGPFGKRQHNGSRPNVQMPFAKLVNFAPHIAMRIRCDLDAVNTTPAVIADNMAPLRPVQPVCNMHMALLLLLSVLSLSSSVSGRVLLQAIDVPSNAVNFVEALKSVKTADVSVLINGVKWWVAWAMLHASVTAPVVCFMAGFHLDSQTS